VFQSTKTAPKDHVTPVEPCRRRADDAEVIIVPTRSLNSSLPHVRVTVFIHSVATHGAIGKVGPGFCVVAYVGLCEAIHNDDIKP